MRAGLNAGIGSRRNLGGGSAPAAITATGLTFRWNPNFSTLTTATDGGGRTVVTQINDMVAGAHLATTTAAESPVLMVDKQGRRFLRFNDKAWMAFTTAAAMDYKAVCLYFVGRMHRPPPGGSATQNILYLNGYVTFAHMNVATSDTTPFLRMVNGNTSNTAGRQKLVAGSQLQVLCTRSTTTIAVRVNENQIAVTGAATAGTQGTPGGLVGAASTTPAAATIGGFDMYEIAGYTGIISDADVTSNCNSYQSYFNIGNISRSITLEGDSRTFGWVSPGTAGSYGNGSLIPSGDCLAVQLAMNSADNNVRIVSNAATGNAISDLVTQRDLPNSLASNTGGFVTGWQNDWHYLIGTNDQAQLPAAGSPVWTTTESTVARANEAMDRANGMIALLNTVPGSVGYLQRGLRVYCSTEIARTTATDMVAIDQFRSRVTAGAFLTACDANVGGTYDGKLIINPLDAWTVSGSTIFSTLANAGNFTYYAPDSLHLSAAGTYQYALSIRGALGLTPA